MSDRSRCPWCGSEGERSRQRGHEVMDYECGTTLSVRGKAIQYRNGDCYEAEIAALRAKLAAAEAACAELTVAMRSIREVDKTRYEHHEPRPDGKQPRDADGGGGTCWLTPKQIATNVLENTHPGQHILAKLAEAEAIIAKQPKTADGVPVSCRDTVWYPDKGHSAVHKMIVAGYSRWDRVNLGWDSRLIAQHVKGIEFSAEIDVCYSTHAAAMEALNKETTE